MARLKISDENIRKKRFSVYVNEAEESAIAASAKRENLKVTDYLRRRGLHKNVRKMIPKINIEFYQELSVLIEFFEKALLLVDAGKIQNFDTQLLASVHHEVQKLRFEMLLGTEQIIDFDDDI